VTGSWSSTPPTDVGRYWWRAPDPHGRPEHQQYGLFVVSWEFHSSMPDHPPKRRMRSMCIFNSSYGGEMETGGWSLGGGNDWKTLASHYVGIEFWSEPERGPGGFMPDLPGKPAWTPRDPKVVEEELKKSKEASAKRHKEELDERTQKIADAKASGETLYECESCDELHCESDLVQVRECPHCNDEKFDGTENGQSCPSCNRRFTRNITETGCPECLDECEVLAEDAPEEPKPEPAPAPKKRKR